MTGETQRLSSELTAQQVGSMAVPLPEFSALQDIPSYLGYRAHGRLEEILGMPVASDDSSPEVSNPSTGQQTGLQLGTLLGREKEFTRNLPTITANVQSISEGRGVPQTQVWDEITEVLIGSGIGKPMHRTLSSPVGGSYGAKTFIEEKAEAGIALVIRENIANWGARRHDRATALIGSLSQKALSRVGLVVYAGSARQYTGAELWRPELRQYVTTDEEGKEVTTLTEALAAETIHIPKMRELLGKLGLSESVNVSGVAVDNPKASGDDVMRAIAQKYGEQLSNMLIVEVGNAPAGYTQLTGALVLAREFGIDVNEQYLAVTDEVQVVRPDHFQALDAEGRSKVQNAVTALNSFNGWLQAIARVNDHQLQKR